MTTLRGKRDCSPVVAMVKISIVFLLGALGAALAYPLSNDLPVNQWSQTDELDFVGRQDPISPVLGAISTALLPVVNAILGPILTNIANGISSAFNNNANNQGTTTTTTTTAKPSRLGSIAADESSGHLNAQPAFVVRVPGSDAPLYLYPHPAKDASGLPPFGPETQLIPLNFGKIDSQEDNSDDESVAVELAESSETKPQALPTSTKRNGLLKPKTAVEYA